MKPTTWIVIGALFGLLAVAAGAFGAHALKSKLSSDSLAIFETAARYQMFHALALVLIGIMAKSIAVPMLEWSGLFFFSGIILFSGSLYLLVFTGVTAFGAVTPIGGLCFLIGWLLLAFGAYRG